MSIHQILADGPIICHKQPLGYAGSRRSYFYDSHKNFLKSQTYFQIVVLKIEHGTERLLKTEHFILSAPYKN